MTAPRASLLLAGLLTAMLPAQDRAAIERAVATLRSAPAFAHARLGIAVVDVATGERLAQHDAELAAQPASNLKLLTAAVALQTLGPDFTFATRVVAQAPCYGAIAGDLWLVGDGDPSLGGRLAATPLEPLQPFVEQLFARGVRRVLGAVRGDASVQRGEPYGRGWQWDDLIADYAAPCSGLCFHENMVELQVRGSGVFGQPAVVRAVPEFGLPPFVANVRSIAAGSAARLAWQPPATAAAARLDGDLALDANATLGIAIAEPAHFAAQALLAALRARGIAVDRDADVGTAPTDAITLATIASPPLRALLRPMLTDSVNLYAEQLWRTAARRAGAEASSVDAERHARAVLQQIGVDLAGLVMADGSGMSRRDHVTPIQLTTLLAAAWRAPWRDAFVDALPRAGLDGTLRRRFADGAARGRVRAKTGSLDYTVALSGYVPRRAEAAPPLAFALLANGVADEAAARAAFDACVEQLALAAGWRAESAVAR